MNNPMNAIRYTNPSVLFELVKEQGGEVQQQQALKHLQALPSDGDQDKHTDANEQPNGVPMLSVSVHFFSPEFRSPDASCPLGLT
jgi:hypothetical protein